MNQENIGKLIAKQRKKLNMTQSELGKKLGVTDKSVSKWERGVNVPDISIIVPLCNILNISTDELLSGVCENTTTQNINSLSDLIKFYSKKSNLKLIKIFCILIIILLFSGLLLFWYSNFNKIRIYKIHTENNDIEAKGYLIYSPVKKTIILNNITYNDIYTGSVKEVQSNTYSLKIMSGDKTILELGMYDSEETITINDFLKQIYMENTEIIDKKDEMIKFDELKDLRLEIRYKNKQEEFKTLEAPLKLENDFASNRLFYN